MPFARLAALVTVAVILATPSLATAQVTVADAWARAVVPGQKSTGAFMRLTATADATLLEAASPAAKIVEIHEMKMEGGVMKMNAIDKLSAAGGQARRVEAGRLSRDADGPHPAAEGRRHRSHHADRRRQGGQDAEDRCPRQRQGADRHAPRTGH